MKLSTILQTYKKQLNTAINSKAPALPQDASQETRDHIAQMTQRFHGAMNFINNTTINQDGNKLTLKDLPWYLVLGPACAGKTTVLANARVNYVLQKNFVSAQDYFGQSEDCDWWITRHAGILDIPSQYLFSNSKLNESSPDAQKFIWKYFLSLLKKHGGKENINGIVIALPLPEMMLRNDAEAQQEAIRTISQRINEIQMTLERPLPCYLLITKCDLLAGFREFFAEATDDEINQAWGIMLPRPKNSEQTERLFEIHFNELIKKLNQQLLARMHQERDPMVRPYIKNFPLQIERLKTHIAAVLAQLNSGPARCILHGIYLTSAVQVSAEPESVNFGNGLNAAQKSLQIFKEPTGKSRPYFIRQFIDHGLQSPLRKSAPAAANKHIRYGVYAASAIALISAAAILGSDFKIGFQKTKQIQTSLKDYSNVLQQFHNPDESMLKTLQLLETLNEAKVKSENKGFFKRLTSHYSEKSEKNASAVYNNALHAFLIPEISNYFADYLRNPINRDAESIYSVFKAYLMLGDTRYFDSNYISSILSSILPASFSKKDALLHHLNIALDNYQSIKLDNKTITNTRKYLLSLRGSQLGYIILQSMGDNTAKLDALLGNNVKTTAMFTSKKASLTIPSMYTGKSFVDVFEQQIPIAANEVATGNWILGTDFRLNSNPNYMGELTEELRNEYVKKYADTWETVLNNVQIETPRDLGQADAIINSMISYDSPLLRILNNIHENTFFEPITTASPRLFSIGQLIDRNNASKAELYQILQNLESLHAYLHPVLSAEDPRKAAYQLITRRMQHQGEADPITKLRMAADQSPMPVKAWINQLTNDTWHYLLTDSMRYLDTSWSEKVTTHFQTQLAGRYPFNNDAMDEVSYQKFTHFFGKPGTLIAFFNNYLTPFVDTSKPQWSWKKLDGQQLPLSEQSLQNIQQAMQIHQAFFPNDDDNLSVPFALQQKKLAKNIESIMLNINSKVIVDKNGKDHNPHQLTWPYNYDVKYSSVALTLAGNKQVQADFPGPWGWFKLVNQAFESSKSERQIILNFSDDENPAQYLLSTNSKNNPFLLFSLNKFNLPEQLTTIQA